MMSGRKFVWTVAVESKIRCLQSFILALVVSVQQYQKRGEGGGTQPRNVLRELLQLVSLVLCV